ASEERPALLLPRPTRHRLHGAPARPTPAAARPRGHGDGAERAALLRALPSRGRREPGGVPPAAAGAGRAAGAAPAGLRHHEGGVTARLQLVAAFFHGVSPCVRRDAAGV